MIPIEVQQKKNGPWARWNAGHVDYSLLQMKARQSAGEPIFVNGCMTYAIKLDGGRMWTVQDGFVKDPDHVRR